MAGVGKIGLVILLLMLCVPVSVRLARSSGVGRPLSLPGWLMRVCHHGPVPRGTQRRSRWHPNEPLTPLVEQESRSDLAGQAVGAAIVLHEATNVSSYRLLFLVTGSDPVSDPAFLCTFLI
jgi:hypothetical protein